jgi:glutamyl-tRNA reductase
VLKIAENKLGTFTGRSFLFIGNSRLNRSMIPLLKRKAPSRISLSTTSPDGFVDPDVEVFGRREVGRWREYDCVIAATTVDEPIVLGSVGSYTLLFDLGVPRNIDPALTLDPTALVYNIEEIHHWMDGLTPKLAGEIEFSERLLKQEVAKLARIYRLKVGVAGVAGKWDHIPDVFHAARK